MRRRLAFLVLLVLALAQGCRKDGTSAPPVVVVGGTATPPALLSTSSPTKDEDPSVLRARDGSLYIAWFSDRGGRSDIYISRSVDKATWSSPVRVTSNPFSNFYPNLLQDASGTLHVVWFEWVSLRVGQIRHSTSVNGVVWTPEEAVTTEFLLDDWVPSIAETSDGTLVVTFVSEKRSGATAEIYVARKRPAATVWDAPVRLSVNSATEHDQLPFVARTGAALTMVWVRHDTRDANFITNPKSELFTATSTDGLAWSTPVQVTLHTGNVANLFPQLFQRHDGTWAILWLSTRSGSPRQYELPLARAAQFPMDLLENTFLPAGYSHRQTATATAGEYLASWVQGAEGAQDVYYRFVRR
jgi:hypothetical protein